MKTHAIRMQAKGGPEVLRWEEVELPEPAAGEVRIRYAAIGVNYIDTYHRTGLYPIAWPSGLGSEGAGVVEAVGSGVTRFKVGDRVAHGTGPLGAYAERRNFPADLLLKLPEAIDDRSAAAMMLKGMTVEYLVRRTFAVKSGQTVLLHAAAGGVGTIAVQWLKHLGATVIGTAGGAEKLAKAKALGADHVIDYRTENIVERVKAITGGKGVPVVFDGVGKDTFMASLDCLSPRGMMVTFGNASGPVPPVEPILLSQKGSLYLTRPTLGSYTATRADLEQCANALFDVVAKGAVKIQIDQTYPLREAAQAHRDLQARKTTGAIVLLP